MTSFNLNSATASNMTQNVTEYAIDSMSTDSATGLNEFEYSFPKAKQQWGYFNSVPDLKSAILLKAIWNVGKGYNCDIPTKVKLGLISGWGKDTFDDILFNLEVTKRVYGDAFAEIIRSDDGDLLNLKVLDTAKMKIIVDEKGIIKRYEQIAATPNGKAIKFEPKDILHLSNNRLSDQVRGISDIDVLEKVILAEEESFDNVKRIAAHQAKPMIMFKLGTDDQTKINTFVAKMDAALNKGENVYIPDDSNSVDFEVIQVNISQVIMEWRNDIRNKFYRTIGLPQIVPGGSGQSTESESKVIYLAFEQIVERDQRQIEAQLWNQLSIKIDLIPPTSLSAELQADTSKDGNMQQMGFQPSDMQAGVGR